MQAKEYISKYVGLTRNERGAKLREELFGKSLRWLKLWKLTHDVTELGEEAVFIVLLLQLYCSAD